MAVKVDIKGLEEELLKYMKTYSQEYAKEGSKQITKKAESCMAMFYRDYMPKYYNRTFDLRDNSYVPYCHDNGKVYYGGVRITSDFMSPYYSGGIMNHNYTDPFVVTQLGWNGWHGDPTGYNGKFDPIRTTSPLDVLMGFAQHKILLNFVDKRARKKASQQNYKYLDVGKVEKYV